MKQIEPQMFEAIFNQARSPIVVLKADKPIYTIVAFNEYYKRTTRTPTNNLIGKGAFEVYNPEHIGDDRQFKVLVNSLNQSLESKQQVKLPVLYFERLKPDGKLEERTWWQIQINPIFDANGNVEYFMCVTLNVTAEELAQQELEEARNREQLLLEEVRTINEELTATNEELISSMEELSSSKDSLYLLNSELEERIKSRTAALAESENRYRAILNALPQIAWTNTLRGDVDFYNQRWYDYTGLDFEQTKDWGWRQIIHPDDLEYNLERYTSILKSNTGGEFEIREKGHDGTYKWHLIRIEPVVNRKGKVQSWIGTATDIDHLKKLQYQKDDFINIASHELKTPITSLRASLQILTRLKSDPAAKMFGLMLEQANKSMGKINAIVEGLLNVSRFDRGQIQLNKKYCVISEIINDYCSGFAESSEYKIQIQGDLTVQAFVDPLRIDQIVINLINNATKYASNSKEIIINIEGVDNFVKVSFIDKGPGITAEKLKHIFDRYYRADVMGNQVSGLGLGLYICAEIVKLHGGQIGVESELGKGSTFWFKVPIN